MHYLKIQLHPHTKTVQFGMDIICRLMNINIKVLYAIYINFSIKIFNTIGIQYKYSIYFQKIVKTKYLKKESKIENHDASVQKNWTDLKNGQMDNLPQELSNHLKKFSHRSQNFKPFISSEKIVVPQKLNISTEFSDIITGYENLRNKCQDTAESSNKKPDTIMNLTENKDTKLGTTSNRKAKHMTLQEFKDQIKTNVIKGETVAMDDKIILDNAQNNDGTQSIAKLQPEDFTNITKIKDQHGSLLTKSEKDYQHLVYPEKIRIPKDKLKHGYTYRLHDCYYDSDGLFLYRVPGME